MPPDERGASSIIVAILLVVLLGFGALAVDVGAMYSEKGQLQNGADAAALAIAQECAAKASTAPCAADQTTRAVPFANGNSVDGDSGVISATVNAGVVDVLTETPEKANGEHFSLYLARALGFESVEIQAAAQATFGGIGAADTIPLTFSQCESDATFVKGLQFFPTHGDKIAEEPPYNCAHQSSSGHELPGGFGWLKHPGTVCSVHVDVDDPWIEARPGTSFDESCASTFDRWAERLDAGQEVKVLIPIFDTACPEPKKVKTGPDPCLNSPFGKAFHIEAFAQLSIRGWHLTGGGSTYMTDDATDLSTALKLKNSDTGLFGEFIRRVSLVEAATMGGPVKYGALGVMLTQ
ncbi:TadE/TadG family type IV pilus assembly protein [Pseudarthrobacter sp. BIM B-2242]|uniref:TadE/TadG family type IV pilus assembly protein n=1 Tax=Pseudarthrobacter sp. BIM B-2242 TaxID=2772401 RepID=UPI001CC4FB00|nr:pilus assembly protein TadG-related protein [Pseudarthrobacter sp. BIM B-2242]